MSGREKVKWLAVSGSDKGLQDRSTYASILSMAKNGANKSDLARSLSLSTQQLRRLTAELVDKGFLRVDSKSRLLMTTDKGLVFLRTGNTSG